MIVYRNLALVITVNSFIARMSMDSVQHEKLRRAWIGLTHVTAELSKITGSVIVPDNCFHELSR